MEHHFIGRETELHFLEERYQSAKAELIVLYGRRRIGKTETLKKFCEGKPHVFFSCRECTDKMQLKNFSEKLLAEGLAAAKYLREFQDWEAAFSSIMELPYGGQKKLLVIDEFPYMCKGNRTIPSLLQNLWDGAFKEQNVMLVFCGSSMSFIEKELLSEKNPLYGRATGIYKMKEMNFYDVIKFFPDYSAKDKIMAYAVLGGIPHYLSQFDPKCSLEENIKKNILTKGCVLYSEVEFLLRQELRETPLYNSIIEAVALGNTRLNDISNKSLLEDTSKASVYLKNLIELGIIEREFSVTEGAKKRANTSRGLYHLTDQFFRFWYAFAFTNYSELESGDVNGVYKYVIAPKLHEYASYTFEEVCRTYIREAQKAGVLPFHYTNMGRWWGKTTVRQHGKTTAIQETEIDILAYSQYTKEYLIGECKFRTQPFQYSEYLDTKSKLTKEQENHPFYYYLFSENGFVDQIIEVARQDTTLNLRTMEDIVEKRW
ncbi:MAG: ATP-binding protein [Lachnospiraceae bacterium]|jgi:AAA+ ATPase superfamily predicted ATPase|nr:ATP-binding protein [Lachnospiraceae bacterium]